MKKRIGLTLFGLMLAVSPAGAVTVAELWEWLNDILGWGGIVNWLQ